MQYTGLKDINGKDVYQDDILLSPGWIYIVVFNEEKFCWYAKISNSRNSYPLWQCKDIKIIGNIYENQELLNDE
jgi:hypothetical protein